MVIERHESRLTRRSTRTLDNVTHSFFGALVAEVLADPLVPDASRAGLGGAAASSGAARAPTASERNSPGRTLALFTSILSNNLPDFDFVYRNITSGRLGYLLHHRGHTHTVPGALALGALAFVIAWGWTALRGKALSRSERRVLAVLAFAGPFLHIALDYGNNYGVHPFWPVDEAWFYGDTIFIVEPLLWAAAVPPLLLLAEARWTRLLLLGVFCSGLLIAGPRGLSVGSIAVIVGAFGAVHLACLKSRPARRAWLGLGTWLAVTAAFAIEGRAARAHALAVSQAHFPTTRVVDIVTTPRPANPFCWSALLVGSDGARYVVRRARVSTAPWQASCTPLDGSTATAPLRILALEDRGVLVDREFSAPLEELRELERKDCRVAAFLRYARAPYWTFEDGGMVVGDLRFDRSRALDFTDIPLSRLNAACPRHVPPWKPPRSDLLE